MMRVLGRRDWWLLWCFGECDFVVEGGVWSCCVF